MKKYNILFSLLGLVLISCGNPSGEDSAEVEKVIGEVNQTYAPDSRVALFDIEAKKKADTYLLTGESNLPKAVARLKNNLEKKNISYTDSIKILPDTAGLEGKTMGVVKISVANLRDEPKHSAQLVTQATLGMPLKVYKKQGGWYYVQTPDDYLAWVDYGGIENMSKNEFATWKQADKLIFLNPFGESFKEASENSATVGDLVAGDVLELLGEENGFYRVQYPNKKKAFVKKDIAQPYTDWLGSLESSRESLVETSKELMGLPYLWGGTSPKGVDCSGFTKTVYFLNGMVLPRDASQQVHTGKLVDSTKNFKKLVAGDLLFFGRPATDSTSEKVVHVGMWIGDNKFIHSMGEVHISDFDTTSRDFDKYNWNRYLRTKRLLDQENNGITYLRKADIFINTNNNDSLRLE